MFKRQFLLLMMIAACTTFFTIIFIEMNEKGANNLYEQASKPGSKNYYIGGVLDRFETNQAVILLEDVNKQVTIPSTNLPAGSKENMWFQLKEKNGIFEVISIDFEKTEKEREGVQKLLEVLRE